MSVGSDPYITVRDFNNDKESTGEDLDTAHLGEL